MSRNQGNKESEETKMNDTNNIEIDYYYVGKVDEFSNDEYRFIQSKDLILTILKKYFNSEDIETLLNDFNYLIVNDIRDEIYGIDGHSLTDSVYRIPKDSMEKAIVNLMMELDDFIETAKEGKIAMFDASRVSDVESELNHKDWESFRGLIMQEFERLDIDIEYTQYHQYILKSNTIVSKERLLEFISKFTKKIDVTESGTQRYQFGESVVDTELYQFILRSDIWKINDHYYDLFDTWSSDLHDRIKCSDIDQFELNQFDILDNVLEELNSEIESDICTHKLTEWLHSDMTHTEYLGEAITELGEVDSGFMLLSGANYLWKSEMYNMFNSMLEELINDLTTYIQ